ncbi:hypothetical protein [Clostridium taeniosporum]|uniref:ABC transporter permease n=1 Tax=Clostridium taeniosporum TaxID=394958 RepID=A0A1D7XJJ3_9CLOT|nr:hypothetical protein [Clostridium taeniosporum]AOR23514.1 hypothetical protein BGI42_07095 [Clostridium taeniosporum]
MKTYLNKALIYQWFNSAKFAIIAGVLFWGIYSNSIIDNVYMNILHGVSIFNSNEFETVGLEKYFILGLIFLVIYMLTFGVNKRNTEIFLSSGPYTKKQIKFNELICYMITLGVFVLTYLYISITFYIRNRESFIMLNGYSTIIMIEIIKIILLGMLGIIIMLIIEAMFSNSMVGLVFMMVIPISFLFSVLEKFFSYHHRWINMVTFEDYSIDKELNGFRSCGIFDGYLRVNEIRMRNLFIASLILIAIILVFLLILNYVQRKNSLENNVGFFASIWSKNIVVIYISVTFGIILSDLVLGGYKDKFTVPYYLSKKISVGSYLTGLGVDLGLSAVVGILIYIIFKKISKKLA